MEPSTMNPQPSELVTVVVNYRKLY